MTRLFRSTLIILLGCIALFTFARAQDSSGVTCLARLPYTTNIKAVTVSGNYAFLADSGFGLRIIDITNRSTPVEVATLPLGTIYNVVISGNYAYVANGASGLRIVNIADPTFPYLIGFVDTLGSAVDVAVEGSYAYVVDGIFSFRVVNVANVDSVYEVARLMGDDILIDGPRKVVISGNHAFVIGNSGSVYIAVLNISLPSEPQIAALYLEDGSETVPTLSGPEITTIFDIAATSNALYLSCMCFSGSGGLGNPYFYSESYYLRTLDIFDLDSIRAVRTEIVSSFEGNTYPSYDIDFTQGISASSDHVYLANKYSGLWIDYAPNPATRSTIGHYNTPGHANSVAISGNYAFIADGTNFGIYDCSQALGVVDRVSAAVPEYFSLQQNYPNPFNSSTTIEYTIPKSDKVELKLFDITGREVNTLVNFNQNPGTYRVKLDASKLASGVYFYRSNAGSFSTTRKLSVLK